MTTAEILARATPRPWPTVIVDLNKVDVPWEQKIANDVLAYIAVNAHEGLQAQHERDQQTIRALTEALQDCITAMANNVRGEQAFTAAIQKGDAALALAKQA